MLIIAGITEGYVKIYTEVLKILKNVYRSAVTYNTKDYPLFLFEDIIQISVKKMGNIFIEVILRIIFEDLQINIDIKNCPTLFLDILYYSIIIYKDIDIFIDYYTIIIYKDTCTGFRLSMLWKIDNFQGFQ